MTALLQRFGPMLLMLAIAGGSFWLLQKLDVGLFSPESSANHTPDSYLENFVSTTMNEEGLPHRRVEAEYMAHFPDTDTYELQSPYVVMYRAEGQEPWHVRSERGWVSADGDVMLLLGKVNIWRNNDNGNKELDVKTEDLRVLPEKEYGETDKAVVITTPTSETHGVGMKAHLKESRLELLSKVRTRHDPTKN